MSRFPASSCFLACALLFTVFTASSHADITVETRDGRVLTGEVDGQTDESLLWLRQEGEQIMLTSSVPWEAIRSATLAGKELPLDQLSELLRQQTTSEPDGFLVNQVLYEVPVGCQDDCSEGCEGACFNVSTADYLRRQLPAKVRSLVVEAYLVNLDRDVEPDGLELFILAFDENDVPVPAKGNLSVRLWGERIQPNGSHVRHETLQQWNQEVKRGDFSREGWARYTVRFRTFQPGFDLSLHPDALVDVRLGVWGQGNFAASVPVQIRHFNPFRDRLQNVRGTRYFREELTAGGRRIEPVYNRTRPHRIR